MTAETNIEKRLRLAVKAAGGRCIKLPAIWYRGIPDRLVLLRGRPRLSGRIGAPIEPGSGQVWFLELKKEGAPTTGKVRPGQSAWCEFLQEYGFNYRRLVGMAEVEEFIDEYVKEPV